MPYATSLDGTRIHYTVTGRRSGPPVLLIQGLGFDKHGWDLQRMAMMWRYRTIAMDNRGAGRSDSPHSAFTLDDMADDAIAVLDAVGVQSAHVVGASMGGAVSQILAIRHPDRLRSLSLVCTACRKLPWRMELIASWRDTAVEHGMGAMTRQAARWVIGPRSFRRILPAMGWLGPMALGRPVHAFTSQVNAILAADEHDVDALAEIEVPSLVVVGNQDILTPRGDSEELAERIPTAELVVISGAAHGLMIEHHTTFTPILLEFLGRAEAAHRDRMSSAEPAGRRGARRAG